MKDMIFGIVQDICDKKGLLYEELTDGQTDRIWKQAERQLFENKTESAVLNLE